MVLIGDVFAPPATAALEPPPAEVAAYLAERAEQSTLATVRSVATAIACRASRPAGSEQDADSARCLLPTPNVVASNARRRGPWHNDPTGITEPPRNRFRSICAGRSSARDRIVQRDRGDA